MSCSKKINKQIYADIKAGTAPVPKDKNMRLRATLVLVKRTGSMSIPMAMTRRLRRIPTNLVKTSRVKAKIARIAMTQRPGRIPTSRVKANGT
jgi:hypothetical protein